MANDRHNDEYSIESILNEDFDSDASFTLESILAEYKSEAFADGDKKTPSELLQKKTDEILKEETENTIDEAAVGHNEHESEDRPSFDHVIAKDTNIDIDTIINAVEQDNDDEPLQIKSDFISDDDHRFFKNTDYADEPDGTLSEIVNSVIDSGKSLEDEDELEEERGTSLLSRIFKRKHVDYTDESIDEEEEITESETEDEREPIEEPDPDIKTEALRFAEKVPSLRFRAFGAFVISFLMFLITYMYDKGSSIPIIGTNQIAAVGTLLIMELLVALLGIDILISGINDLISAEPGAETLILLSCFASVLDGFVILISKNFSRGLPFSLISALSVAFAISSRKAYYMAMCDSLKASVAASVPYGVVTDSESITERSILKKVTGAYDGFYKRLIEADFGETVYSKLAPILIVFSVAFAFLSSVCHGRAGAFPHILSIMTAISAAFPISAVFALPFRYTASRTKKAGAALGGWGGACDIYYSDGALLTDLDIYPTGSVSLSGLKIFEGIEQKKVIVYTSSLIIASQSGLTKVFEELLRSQGFLPVNISDFTCYDGGGIGAVIDGDKVLVGTSAFMNLMGIRIPENINTKGSIFSAVNGEMSGVFSINYIPANSVQSALVALLGTKTNILMAVRDFNVTPNSIQQKFKVSMQGVEAIPIETTYRLSENSTDKSSGASAILCRGGLAPFAEVITRGRLLKIITELNTIISAAATAILMIIMFFLSWLGSFEAASAENAFIFMMLIEVIVFVLSQTIRKRI